MEKRPIPTYGDLMTIGDWIDAVHQGYFIDYDGVGSYSDGEFVYDNVRRVYPSDVIKNRILTKFSHIVWYNR